MRTMMAVAVVVLLGCGSGPGAACVNDDACAGALVCSTTAGDTCAELCGVAAAGEACAPVNGTPTFCGKYVGPTSAGYACAPR